MLDYSNLKKNSSLTGANAAYIDDLYAAYVNDPTSVASEWRDYFASLGTADAGGNQAHAKAVFETLGKQSPAAQQTKQVAAQQEAVDKLIDSYRRFGHTAANTDPLNLAVPNNMRELTLSFHGLSESDLSKTFATRGVLAKTDAPLRDILDTLKNIYCSHIGAEFMHIADTARRQWLLERFEKQAGRAALSAAERVRILKKLVAADGLEKYLGTKYVGQKRFSIEGADALIAIMDHLTARAAGKGVKEIIVGMAHRGRLNMLVNFLGKKPSALFDEFEGRYDKSRSGDVKYHKGFSSNVITENGSIHLAMAYNPSHLEIINPVLEGSVRAKQWRRDDKERRQVLPVLIHGDAAFSGQGVNQETFNLSRMPGYATGGTLHIVVNNQVGFTTSAIDSRSTRYCTDIAKMVDAPIFHANGDDPEACILALQLLFDYRQAFNDDVVIDLVCYRRHGHNEADEPMMTQPMMYHNIKAHLVPHKLYAERLVQENVITSSQLTEMETAYRQSLDSGEAVVDLDPAGKSAYQFSANWKEYDVADWRSSYSTVSLDSLKAQAKILLDAMPTFTLQPQVAKLVATREKMYTGEQALDWGTAENLAYATLLLEGHPIRLSGEDVQRGTFGHRHAVLHDYEKGGQHIPLQNLSSKQAPFWIYNSILSEEAVMAFETGYAAAAPDNLVIWEAQFGDFANGAQVIIDQFLSSGEQKWAQKSGLVLLLPHGYEGQGPEHSSARLERYLQLCAQDNMQVVVPTTPAQIFHVLRRQVLRKMRKPLVVMTPKSLLRSPLAVSPLSDLAEKTFTPVISEIDAEIKSTNVKRVVLCSGKVYYDLLTQRREVKRDDVALIRIEQLYPFPDQEVKAILATYSKATHIVWAQEEPLNQGSWYFAQAYLRELVNDKQQLSVAARAASAAPASGFLSVHLAEQKEIIKQALG